MRSFFYGIFPIPFSLSLILSLSKDATTELQRC